MLIDRFLPGYEWNEVHRIDVAAPPEAVLEALRHVTADEVRLLRALLSRRGRSTSTFPAAMHSWPSRSRVGRGRQ